MNLIAHDLDCLIHMVLLPITEGIAEKYRTLRQDDAAN